MRERDVQQKFLVDSCDVRGQLVQLDETWLEAVARTDYPPAVKHILGEAFVAAMLLAGTIKFAGKMTLQVSGEGPIHLLVVQVTNEGKVRGLARWTTEPENTKLACAFGSDARMIITIEANRTAEPYQGIVPLEGDNIATALQTYFRTSEQLPTQLYLSVSEKSAAGVLIQKLPVEERTYHDADGWQRATVLCETLTEEEMCKESAETLLFRLFHEERVRLFDPQTVAFHCSCSRERTDGMLAGLGKPEVDSIVEEQGSVEITCEFCDALYAYDAVDVAALFKGVSSQDAADTDDGDVSPGTLH
ncbi:MAG: Hsp33 family molecular chaperone HslO [Granulosicoccus sp.]